MEKIKQETKVDIEFKRGVLKRKISDIRKKNKRKIRQIQQQINLIRAETANEIMEANKRGDQELCRAARKDMTKITSYCDKNLNADYNKNINCKEPENFCYACCENEFGNMFLSQRDDCQSMCDNEENGELNSGDWIWKPSADKGQNTAVTTADK